MRIFLWLTILVFISTLFWPQLLNDTGIILCSLIGFIVFCFPRFRVLAVVPFVAIYFSLYTNLTLTGNASIPFTNNTSLQEFVDGQDHALIVQVNSLINQKNKSYFTAKLIELDNHHLNFGPELEMRWYKPTLMVQAGQVHSFRVRFKPIYGRANPAGFDRQKWRFSEHIAYQVNIREHLEELSSQVSLRANFYQKIKNLSASLENQGIILALSFADKTLMSQAQKEQIKKLSISHLFAISGLHIGLLFSFVYLLVHFLLSRLVPVNYLGWSSWRLVSFTSLIAAFFYAYLAGFSLPTQRAFLMLLIAVVALSMKRRFALFDLIGLTLFIILVWDPLAVLSAGLWLSFSAVVIILITLWRFSDRLLRNNDGLDARLYAIKRYIKFLFLIQLSITLLMLPMQLFYFSAFNWLSPFVNFIAVPLFSLLIIPLILLGCLFALFSTSLGLFCLSSADQLITLFFNIVAGVEGAYHIYSVNFSLLIGFLICLSLVMFVIYFHVNNNRKISVIFTGIMLVIIGFSFWEREHERDDSWFVEAFDVGQGLSVLIRSEGETLLYDTGPRYPSGFNTATTEIIPYLQSIGVTGLDYLVISHSDIDHAGGFSVIMENFSPKNVFLGEPLSFMGDSDSYPLCKAGQKWSLGALEVTALSPKLLSKNNNNNSCVLQIKSEGRSLLLTGDIDKKQEATLIEEQGDLLASDLLFAPHHGSKHSSSIPFIQEVAPQWVVFSAGFMNRWNFPAEEVKFRYKNQSVNMVNSGVSGFIRFEMNKDQIKMQTYREDLAAYWYHHSFSL